MVIELSVCGSGQRRMQPSSLSQSIQISDAGSICRIAYTSEDVRGRLIKLFNNNMLQQVDTFAPSDKKAAAVLPGMRYS
jgi:hypothetical protein